MRWAAFRLAHAGYDVESLFDEVPDSLGTVAEFEDIDGMDVVLGPLQQSILSRVCVRLRNLVLIIFYLQSESSSSSIWRTYWVYSPSPNPQ